MSGTPERVIVLWIPDWPVQAYRREHESELGALPHAPLALIAQHRVVACSPEARAAGVRVGSRERDARMCCPGLDVHPHDPDVDVRHYAPVLAAIEQAVPGVEPLRPGVCAMRARGPARYYGSEEDAAKALITRTGELGFPHARVGIADGRFTAEQAARAAVDDAGVVAPSVGVRIVPTESTAAFLRPLPVSRAASAEFAETLLGLGIRTLGALSSLPEDAVRQRFGSAGLAAHRRARGLGPAHAAEVRPRAPEQELAVDFAFEPPLDGADQLAFASSAHAESLIRGLIEQGLVCTELRVELTDDIGVRHERAWAHPSRFTAADVVNRVRWQVATLPRVPERGGAGIAGVLLTPTRTAHAAAHEPGLWSTAPDERVHHHLSRLQSLVGHEGVGTGELLGGRLSTHRQRLVAWGTRADERGTARARARLRDGPWPGRLSGALPNTVFSEPIGATLLDPHGSAVHPDDEDLLGTEPARLSVDGALRATAVSAWSSPWPLRERWWAGDAGSYRLQILLEDGDAWLLRYESGTPTGRWIAEAHYA